MYVIKSDPYVRAHVVKHPRWPMDSITVAFNVHAHSVYSDDFHDYIFLNYFLDQQRITVSLFFIYKEIKARGISVCSNEDSLNWKKNIIIGQDIAQRRALRAYHGRPVAPFKRDEVIRELICSHVPFTQKAECNPTLTLLEAELAAKYVYVM